MFSCNVHLVVDICMRLETVNVRFHYREVLEGESLIPPNDGDMLRLTWSHVARGLATYYVPLPLGCVHHERCGRNN